MYQLSICPDTEIIHLNKKTIAQAKSAALDYYPAALFMDVIDFVQIAIYDRTANGLEHIGNIWRVN